MRLLLVGLLFAPIYAVPDAPRSSAQHGALFGWLRLTPVTLPRCAFPTFCTLLLYVTGYDFVTAHVA